MLALKGVEIKGLNQYQLACLYDVVVMAIRYETALAQGTPRGKDSFDYYQGGAREWYAQCDHVYRLNMWFITKLLNGSPLNATLGFLSFSL